MKQTVHAGTQVYATSMAMLVTMLISVALFGLSPTLQLGLGIATASISLVLYYGSPATLMDVPPTSAAALVPEKQPKSPDTKV